MRKILNDRLRRLVNILCVLEVSKNLAVNKPVHVSFEKKYKKFRLS